MCTDSFLSQYKLSCLKAQTKLWIKLGVPVKIPVSNETVVSQHKKCLHNIRHTDKKDCYNLLVKFHEPRLLTHSPQGSVQNCILF